MADADPAEERLIADCAQLLTVTLADPAEFSFWDLFERIQQQTADSEPVGRRWIAAVNRVHEAGRLTVDQAHAIIEHVAYSVIGERAARDPEISARVRRISAITESLESGKGPEHRKATSAAKRELTALVQQNALRHEAIVRDFLLALGQEQLARRMEAESPEFRGRLLAALKELWSRDDAEGAGWKVAYPSPDAPLTKREAPPRTDDGNVDRISLADRVEQWRQATRHEGIWTVDAVLAFATIESYDNLDGEGDSWIASIQAARRKGVIDRNLSYLLLDRVAGMMVTGEPGGDTVLRDLQEQMEEIPYTDEHPEGAPPMEYDPRDRAQWEALNAVYERRRERYKLRILGDAGEVEMVRMMEERPAEFRMRVATAATEWEVED
jgi:hypothetical protein